MKTPSPAQTPERRDELRPERFHDAYRADAKLPEPTVCPDCGAVFHGGRWTWGSTTAPAHETRCPACRRIHDRFPAGYLTIGGAFFAEHRDEILGLVRNREDVEKTQHPMERIIAIEEQDDGVLVTTTSAHVARRIADGLHDAWKGELERHYNEAQDLFRARWTRDG
jgi:NMD protein affecting ribosome stability and mRNA decay